MRNTQPAAGRAQRRPMDDARIRMGRLSPARLGLDDIFRRICRIASDTLAVERAGIWLFVHDGAELRCSALYERTRDEYSDGATLQVADFPAYFESLAVRKTIPAEYAAHDPRTNELLETYLRPLGIGSMLDAPILLDGEVIGVVCHEQVGEAREWSTEERDFAGSVADTLAMKIKGAEIAEAKRLRQLDAVQSAAFRKRDEMARLAAGVAHDFRNILTVIIGNLQEMKALAAEREDVGRIADEAVDAAKRGSTLSRQLMELGRSEAGHPRVFDVAGRVASALPMLRQLAGDHCAIEYSKVGHTGLVIMDPEQLERVLHNLVVNARDAMPGGGTIHIVLDAEKAEGTAVNGHHVFLEVKDSGGGIDPGILPKIFDPFFSTKNQREGSGLGLAIVRHIVELAGGSIEVETGRGSGTTFRLILPRVGGG